MIFQNSDDLNLFIKSGIVLSKKAVLIKSSGIDTNEFIPMQKDKQLLDKLNLDTTKPIVLMIARVLKDKGVDEYIKASEILKDKAVFLYVGDIDKGNKNSFNPDWKNVKYLGFRRDIKELISICDIFVLPSYREGVPRTLLEAASMQKAIVTTNATGCKEVVEDNVNGLLVPIKDYKTLAKKIDILVNDKDLREKFAKNGRIKAINEFDIKVVVKKYMEVYKELL
jgi:N,N'-diacetylbacillosaminyl-diphospho-undecaprenol alpha-1,3-N-acetylgalactosaminyltransferase